MINNKCPMCSTTISIIDKKCPNCGFDLELENKFQFFKLKTLIFIIITVLIVAKEFTNIFDIQLKKQNTTVEKFSEVEIPLRRMSSLSGMTKNEIYNLRKDYVKKSPIFSKLNKNYMPRQEVYNITDNLPWISAYEVARNGVDNNPNIGIGESRHSTFVNNPELLIGFLVPSFNFKEKRDDFDKVDYMFPKRLTWDKKNNTIRAYFDFESFFYKYPFFRNTNFYTDETNARDLGYDWILCTEKNNVFFEGKNDIMQKPYQMRGFYHRGYACNLEGGCNNYSPYQQKMIFKIADSNSYIKFKLWKKEPKFKFQKPDLNYEMYFE